MATKSKAIQVLQNLAFNEKKRRYPSLPDYAIPLPNYSDRNANALTKAIIDFIRLKGGQAERISVTGRYIDRSQVVTDCIGRSKRIGSGEWIKSSMQPGTADVSATINGVSVKVEIKIGRDKISPLQGAYKAQVEAAGGIYFIAKSFDQFFNWYNENF